MRVCVRVCVRVRACVYAWLCECVRVFVFVVLCCVLCRGLLCFVRLSVCAWVLFSRNTNAPAQHGKPVAIPAAHAATGAAPAFGPFAEETASALAAERAAAAATGAPVASAADLAALRALRPAPRATLPVPRVKDVIGQALSRIGAWHELSQARAAPVHRLFACSHTTCAAAAQAEHVIVQIDKASCVNCGSCYSTCNDSG